MKIIDIDIIPIYPKIADRNADQKSRFFNINHRTIFKITTDNGIVGYVMHAARPLSNLL